MPDFALLRRTMVDTQLRTFDVNDLPLLDAMTAVPRERFVPPGREGLAYMDQDIAVSGARRMLAPMVAARMIQALDIASGLRVLDVACGLGYTSAVLAELGATVVSLEDDEVLAAVAAERLRELGYADVAVACGPLPGGHAEAAPYDRVLVNGAVDGEPTELLRQLRDGGRLVCIEGRGRAAKATLHVRSGEVFGRRALFDAAAPALPAFAAESSFIF